MIFVFGSNLRGVHGAGAAYHALKNEGAVPGQGVGHYGNSYAIPTKDFRIETLPLKSIEYYVDGFILYARYNQHLQFKVTRIGCGLAGYTNEDIAPMFANAPENCHFDMEWKSYLPGKTIWID